MNVIVERCVPSTIWILQRKIESEGIGFHFISAHQNIESAKRAVKERSPFGIQMKWHYSGFRYTTRTKEWQSEHSDHEWTTWQIFETKIEDYIPPQPESLEFSPLMDEE